MKKAVLYIRSTTSNPPAKQRPRIEQYLEEHGIELIAEDVERPGSTDYPALRRAIEKADGRLVIISNIGQLTRSPTFLSLLREALLEHPQNYSALLGIAELYADRGELRKASLYLKQAIAQDPGNAALQVRLQSIEKALGTRDTRTVDNE